MILFSSVINRLFKKYKNPINLTLLFISLLTLYFIPVNLSLADFPKESPVPAPQIITVTVNNETEFLNAIGSNRIIQMNPGTYKLSDYTQFDYR